VTLTRVLAAAVGLLVIVPALIWGGEPAVEIVVKDAAGQQLARTFLFAKFPDFSHGARDALKVKLRYLYQGKVEQTQAVAVGESAELWRLEQGAVKSKKKIVPGEAFQIGDAALTVAKIYPAVKRSFKDFSRSDRAENPVVRVRVGKTEPRFLKPRQPMRLDEGKVLVLAHKGRCTLAPFFSRFFHCSDSKILLKLW